MYVMICVFQSPHPSITSEYRDSGVCDVDRNYENDDRALAMERALYDATSSLRQTENLPVRGSCYCYHDFILELYFHLNFGLFELYIHLNFE